MSEATQAGTKDVLDVPLQEAGPRLRDVLVLLADTFRDTDWRPCLDGTTTLRDWVDVLSAAGEQAARPLIVFECAIAGRFDCSPSQTREVAVCKQARGVLRNGLWFLELTRSEGEPTTLVLTPEELQRHWVQLPPFVLDGQQWKICRQCSCWVTEGGHLAATERQRDELRRLQAAWDRHTDRHYHLD